MPTQVQSAAEAATPFDPEILVRLSGSLKRVNEGLTPAVDARAAAASGARENVLVVTAPQMKALSLSFTEAAQSAQRGGYPSFSAPFQRVALSLEKMSSGMKGIVDAPRMAGQLTKAGNLHVGEGVVTFVAGFASLFGGNGPDYSGPLSEIHTEIQALRQESQRHFRELAEGLLTHINGLKTTLSHVMENQQIILNAVNHALDGIDDIKTLLKEHVDTTGATLAHIATKSLREAHATVQLYLENPNVNPDPANIDDALNKLQTWLRWELKNPIINEARLSTVSSERMVSILNQQSPLNIPGLIAARLRFLFGNDILDEKYTRLPSLEVYQPTAACFLLGAHKSEFYARHGYQIVCEDIQNTLQLYLDFITDVKGNARLWQALFDLYDVHFYDNITDMEEARLLLISLVNLTGETMHDMFRISKLTSSNELRQIDPSLSGGTRLKILQDKGRIKTEIDLYRYHVRGGPSVYIDKRYSPQAYIPGPGYFQRSVDLLSIYLTQHNLDFTGVLNLARREHKWFSPLGSYEHPSKLQYTYGECLLFLVGRFDLATASFEQSVHSSDRWPKEYLALCQNYDATYIGVGIGKAEKLRANFKYYTLVSQGKLRAAQSFVLERNNLERIHLTSERDIARLDRIDPYYLLDFVALLGRWDIFEDFIYRYPVPAEFNYARIVNGGSLTPLMIAAQHGREDVVNGLILKMTPADMIKRSFDNKTAAQLAFEQGFYKIAYTLSAGLSSQEILQCQDNLSVVATSAVIANPPNQLYVDLAQMKEDVGSLQAAFKSQAESIAQAKVAASSAKAAIFVTRSEESDDDKELVLNEITNEELKPLQPLAWCKPRSTQAQEIGKRILPHTFFRNKREELRLTAELERHTFRVTPDIIDGEKCLVTFAKSDILNARA